MTELLKASRRFHQIDTIVEVGNTKIGNGEPCIIAGPCVVESKEQICDIAKRVKKAGATILRGGTFKPRTSPYDFQGMQEKGLELLLEAKRLTGLPIISEIMGVSQIPLFKDVDIVQVGSRNMQNYELLKALGKYDKPVLLKRGMASTIEELLLSAEYVLAGGNTNVILCERGIRTFETATRNTLDIGAVALLKEMTHLPIIVDPSHGLGISKLVAPASLGAIAVGADGIMVEVHNYPEMALCDGEQSITPDEFAKLVKNIHSIAPFAYKHQNNGKENRIKVSEKHREND
jgi:3-deoxy-7-phosphoheptulonate synthase